MPAATKSSTPPISCRARRRENSLAWGLMMLYRRSSAAAHRATLRL
jgi:hypothetical protein